MNFRHKIAAILVVTFCLLIPFELRAQSGQQTILTGAVIDADESGIPNATVVLLNPETEEIEHGISSDPDGFFELNASEGTFILRISYVSYETHEQEITLAQGEELDIGIINLAPSESTMDEVLVEGERSYMTMNFDSRTFNVGADITSAGGSALDVLDNVPSITTDFEGNVSLRGTHGDRGER